ncbi:MAG TPA: SDR family oxidoreductase [Ignavibacteria bacterium]|nr:SDR family oxidoreductase [Ignavibacteria bacterium]
MKLKNKVAVITGAGKGIGRAVAVLFLKEGAKVVLVSRTKKDLESFITKYKKYESNILTIAGDISKEKKINEVIKKTISQFKKIDVLVNNAGFSLFNDMVDSSTKEYDLMFNTNVKALYLLTRGFLPYMIKRKEGTIINISSLAGKQGFATGSIYCATKHAVMGLSRALMLEVRKYNIRVIAICPGTVDTDFFRKESNTTIYANRDTVVKPEDIAQTCLYAASLPINATASEIEVRPTNPRK